MSGRPLEWPFGPFFSYSVLLVFLLVCCRRRGPPSTLLPVLAANSSPQGSSRPLSKAKTGWLVASGALF